MENLYPALRRPKRKLCYPSNTETISKHQAENLSLGDVDKMFDDLVFSDSLPNDDIGNSPPVLAQQKKQGYYEGSPVPLKGSPAENIQVSQRVAKNITLQCSTMSPIAKLDVDLIAPLYQDIPVKTSSPIKKMLDVGDVQRGDIESEAGVFQSLFDCEDREVEEAKTECPPIQKLNCNGHISKKKDSTPYFKNTPKTVQTGCLEEPKQTPRCLLLKNNPQHQPLENVVRKQLKEPSNDGCKDLTGSIKKIRDFVPVTPAIKRASVKISSPQPDPEDNFQILEDDASFRIFIPRKNSRATSKSSSSEKESSTDKGIEEPLLETHKKTQGAHPASVKEKSQTVEQKMKMKKKKMQNEVVQTENYLDENTFISGDLPPVQQDKQAQPKKTKPKKVNLKSSDLTDDETQKNTKTQRASKKKGSIPAKHSEEHAKPSKAKSTKFTSKPKQKDDTVKVVAEQRQEYVQSDPVEDSVFFPDEHHVNTKKPLAKSLAKAKQKRQSEPQEWIYDGVVPGKRKRLPPQQWWLCNPVITDNTAGRQKLPVLETSEQNHPKVIEAGLKVRNRSNCHPNIAKEKKTNMTKKETTRRANSKKRPKRVEKQEDNVGQPTEDQEEWRDLEDPELDPVLSSHSLSPQRDHSHTSGCTVQQLGPEQQKSRKFRESQKNDTVSGEPKFVSVPPQQPRPRRKQPHVELKTQSKRRTSRNPHRTSNRDNPDPSLQAVGGAPVPSIRSKPPNSVKTICSKLSAFKNIFASVPGSPAEFDIRDLPLHPTEDSAHDPDADSKNMQVTVIQSGPSSMIDMELDEDIVPDPPLSSVMGSELCVSDLCGPPLKPLRLQPKDKASMTEWLKQLWTTGVTKATEITADTFEWFFYKGRAIGITEDLSCGSISNGKLLLGSHMKKPLWVDHNATTVFNIVTSSVRAKIDGQEYIYCPGQSFIVTCGQAFSVQNLTVTPSMMCFTRIQAESPD